MINPFLPGSCRQPEVWINGIPHQQTQASAETGLKIAKNYILTIEIPNKDAELFVTIGLVQHLITIRFGLLLLNKKTVHNVVHFLFIKHVKMGVALDEINTVKLYDLNCGECKNAVE